jgi:hypothetical protein
MTTRGNGIAVKGPVVGRAVAVARLVCEVLIGERPTGPLCVTFGGRRPCRRGAAKALALEAVTRAVGPRAEIEHVPEADLGVDRHRRSSGPVDQILGDISDGRRTSVGVGEGVQS